MKEGVDQFARRRPSEPALWASFGAGLRYVAGNFDDADTYKRLKERLDALDQERGTSPNRVFYLSTPPSEYEKIIPHLAAGVAQHHG